MSISTWSKTERLKRSNGPGPFEDFGEHVGMAL